MKSVGIAMEVASAPCVMEVALKKVMLICRAAAVLAAVAVQNVTAQVRLKISGFNKWFAQQTKRDGNNKLFRNRKGMEFAWNESRKHLSEGFENHVPSLQEYVDAFNPTGESDDA